MKLIEFEEQDLVIAKDQPEYLSMPAHLKGDESGTVTVCWSLSFSERLQLLFTGKVWHQILTFNSPMQPQRLTLEKPDMK